MTVKLYYKIKKSIENENIMDALAKTRNLRWEWDPDLSRLGVTCDPGVDHFAVNRLLTDAGAKLRGVEEIREEEESAAPVGLTRRYVAPNPAAAVELAEDFRKWADVKEATAIGQFVTVKYYNETDHFVNPTESLILHAHGAKREEEAQGDDEAYRQARKDADWQQQRNHIWTALGHATIVNTERFRTAYEETRKDLNSEEESAHIIRVRIEAPLSDRIRAYAAKHNIPGTLAPLCRQWIEHEITRLENKDVYEDRITKQPDRKTHV